MILLTRTAYSGADDIIFVAPEHVVSVRSSIDGNSTHVELSNGNKLHVEEDRNEIVEMIESGLEK